MLSVHGSFNQQVWLDIHLCNNLTHDWQLADPNTWKPEVTPATPAPTCKQYTHQGWDNQEKTSLQEAVIISDIQKGGG